MPKFQASVVEPLEYTFAPFTDASGTTPEPSDKQIGVFLAGIKDLGKEFVSDIGVDQNDPEYAARVMAALNGLSGDDFVKVMDKMADLVAKLCTNQPSKLQLLKAPLRVRNVFYDWLLGEVMSPEVGTGAGKQ